MSQSDKGGRPPPRWSGFWERSEQKTREVFHVKAISSLWPSFILTSIVNFVDTFPKGESKEGWFFDYYLRLCVGRVRLLWMCEKRKARKIDRFLGSIWYFIPTTVGDGALDVPKNRNSKPTAFLRQSACVAFCILYSFAYLTFIYSQNFCLRYVNSQFTLFREWFSK